MSESLEILDHARSSAKAPPREEGAKRRQVLDGARDVFLTVGFDAASMNEIARAAGVSKGTLYVYFASKQELFAALIREEKRAQAEQFCQFRADETDVGAALRTFGVRLLDLMLRPASIAHLRIVVAVADKFPEVGQAFYESGPEFGQKKLAAFLDAQVAAGRLEIDDTMIAGQFFIEMCKAPHLLRAILCVGETPTGAEIEDHVAKAVAVFLRAYRGRA